MEVKPGHSSTRTLQPVTAEKWKTTSLAKLVTENWLIIDVENNSVKSLPSSVCQKYEDRINSVKVFKKLGVVREAEDCNMHLQYWMLKEKPMKLHMIYYLKRKGSQ